MSAKAIETTVHKTYEWITHVCRNMGGPVDRDTGYNVLRGVLHVMRDSLPVDAAAHLGAQLPMLVRGLYYEGWHPAGKPLRLRHADEFLALLERDLSPEVDDIAGAVQAVFRALEQNLDPGAVDKLLAVIPKEIRELWTEHRE